MKPIPSLPPSTWLGLLVGAAVVVAGCKTTVNTYEPAQSSAHRQMVDDKRITTDNSLNNKVNVQYISSARNSTGHKVLQFEVLNRTKGMQNFFYAVEWFDAQGMLVSAASTGWTERQIMGKETLVLSAIAPTAACDDFRLKLIEHP